MPFLITALHGLLNFKLWPLYTQERTRTPILQEAGWAPQRVWTFWKRKILPLLPGLELWTVQS